MRSIFNREYLLHNFKIQVSILFLFGLSFSLDKPAIAQEQKPNVLFIAVDDLNDWVGKLGGHPQVQTPHMDKLMEKGVYFTNAHCSQAVCTASRNSLLSGLHPVTTGWYQSTSDMAKNYDEVMQGNMMLPEYFKNNGYNTFSAGKIFHSGESDFPDKTDKYWTEYAPHFWSNMEESVRKTGFGYRGTMFYPFPRDGGQLVQLYGEDTINNHYRQINRFYSLCGGPLQEDIIPKNGMYDEQIAEWAIDKLNENQQKPFFLAVGFLRPHVPYTAPQKYFDLYDKDQIILPEIPKDEMSDIPVMGKAIARGYTPRGGWADITAKEGALRELVHAYLACVTFVDDQIGKVLQSLEDSQFADNTIIVLWSDHGQHLGEKRHFRKMALWQESTRVPLVIYDPRKPYKGKRDQTVSLLDLYPTLTDLCGLPANRKNEGRSLKPILENAEINWPYPVVNVWRFRNYAVKDQDWRYILYSDGGEELYNHKTDPGEHFNLAGKTEYREIIDQLKKHIPEKEALPAGSESWPIDDYQEMVEKWEENDNLPVWLK